MALASLAGCGGSGESGDDRDRAESIEAAQAKEQAKAQAKAERRRAVETRWREGLTEWSAAMLQPALRVSGLFSGESLTLLLEGDPGVRAELDAELTKLKGCSEAVERIGTTPTRLRPARTTAMKACGSLEAGASLVEIGLSSVAQGGPAVGGGLLTRAATTISKGVDLLGQATSKLPPP